MSESAARKVSEHKQKLARVITNLYFESHPELEEKYGEQYRDKYFEDVVNHLSYLEQSVKVESKRLFNNYLAWARSMYKERDIPPHNLIECLELMSETIREELLEGESGILIDFIDAGIKFLRQEGGEESFLKPGQPLVDEARSYLDFLLAGKRHKAAELIERLVENRVSTKDIYEHIFQKTQYEVGALWQKNQITVAHEHYCTAATQLIMSQLYPRIFSMKDNGHKLLACSVADELHEIGIRMVADFFEMEGWDTHYLGANMPDGHLIKALQEHKPEVLAISATMPLHIGEAEKLIQKLRGYSEFKNIKILIGGYPFRMVPDLWKKIGADASADSAGEAVKIANKLISN